MQGGRSSRPRSVIVLPAVRGPAAILGRLGMAVLFGLCSLCGLVGLSDARADVLHHEVQVRIDPAASRLDVVDELTLPLPNSAVPEVRFLLHAGLSPQCETTGVGLRRLEEPIEAAHYGNNGGPEAFTADVPLEQFALEIPAGVKKVKLRYGGTVHHPVADGKQEYARGFGSTPGIVSEEGVFLSGSTFWLPWLGTEPISFGVEISTPGGWDIVSQGTRTLDDRGKEARIRWEEKLPQDEVYLIAGRFVRYERPAAGIQVQAYLRSKDDDLAETYLGATQQYVQMYSDLIGPYPYSKFALVENFWETGFGMPSFTLLGSKVIRFPFILHSSYPHEILHNWWGNSVYVDYERGNWCEGLTAYLADHLIKEQRGSGAEHRQAALQKYTDYVAAARDFPLTEFRSRHDSTTQAVGYDKLMLVFHMLRLHLGDRLFVESLRYLFRENMFRRISFDDVRRAFDRTAGKPLGRRWSQWIERAGAPELELVRARHEKRGPKHLLQITLSQKGEPYLLDVPVVVTVAGQAEAVQQTVVLSRKQQRFFIELPAPPLRVDIDPEFDLFRRLDRREVAPALSTALGADAPLFVLASAAPAELKQAYRALFDTWNGSVFKQAEIREDSELEALPADRTVWLLGWQNRFAAALEPYAEAHGATLQPDRLQIGPDLLKRDEHSVVALFRPDPDRDTTVAWIATERAEAVAGLARKLPHYGKYSFLGFEGDEPTNVVKGRWAAVGSPLTRRLGPGEALPPRGTLARREPLAQMPQRFSAERLRRDVELLASSHMEGRGFGSEGLERSARWLAAEFKAAGMLPGGDGDGYFQLFEATGGEPQKKVVLKNVVGVLPGLDPALQDQSVVLGAHYDHLGIGWPDVHAGDRGKLHLGADDNASGVAVMLELARVLGRELKPRRSVVFVAFAGEEAGLLGSRRYVRASRLPVGKAIGMINLDTVGRLQDRKLTVLGVGSAREWVHIFFGAGHVTGTEIQPVTKDLGGSDQRSFLERRVPAVQLFTGPHADYHRPGDTADKVDVDGLMKVAAVTREALIYLAGREGPLTVTEAGEGAPGEKRVEGKGHPGVGGHAGGTGRKVSLGTVPDFGFSGPGVKLSGTTTGSPAAKAGLQAGDVILGVAGKKVADLRSLSAVLKELEPGRPVAVRFRRGDEERKVTIIPVAR